MSWRTTCFDLSMSIILLVPPHIPLSHLNFNVSKHDWCVFMIELLVIVKITNHALTHKRWEKKVGRIALLFIN